MSNNKPYTKKQRLKLYGIALKHYKNLKENKNPENFDWLGRVAGMCLSIEEANNRMMAQGYACRNWQNPDILPEYWAFKPKTLWRQDSRYWFTRYKKRGGYKKRVSILQALVDGKTPEQWKAEWKAAGHR